MAVLEKTNKSVFNNSIDLFFLKLGDQFELTEKQAYKIAQFFNTNIKNINHENQEKINRILFHHNISESTQKKNKSKNTLKL